MGYYGLQRGDYYRGDYYRGDPGFLGGLVKGIGKIAGAVVRATPIGGAISTAVNIGRTLIRPGAAGAAQPLPMLPSFAAAQQPVPGVRGAVQRFLPGGATGFRAVRRMNAGNAKAARRAIRRIKAVRNLLKGIERELPMRPARGLGSRGVITRAEAARALRR